jgi:hypothetical protein
MRQIGRLDIDIERIIKKRDNKDVPMPWEMPRPRQIGRWEIPRVRIPVPGQIPDYDPPEQRDPYQPKTPREVYIDFNI